MEELNFSMGTTDKATSNDLESRRCRHQNYITECRTCNRQNTYRPVKGLWKLLLPRIEEEDDANSNVANIRMSNAQRACCVRKVVREQILDAHRRNSGTELSQEERNDLLRPNISSRILSHVRMYRLRAQRERRLALEDHKLAEDLEGLSVSSSTNKPADLSEQFNKLRVDNQPEVEQPTLSSAAFGEHYSPLNINDSEDSIPGPSRRASSHRPAPAFPERYQFSLADVGEVGPIKGVPDSALGRISPLPRCKLSAKARAAVIAHRKRYLVFRRMDREMRMKKGLPETSLPDLPPLTDSDLDD